MFTPRRISRPISFSIAVRSHIYIYMYIYTSVFRYALYASIRRHLEISFRHNVNAFSYILLTRGSNSGAALQHLSESVFILLDWTLFTVPAASVEIYLCDIVGHWRRSCGAFT